LASKNAALQALAIDSSGTTATWVRGGAGPEIEQVTFEQSTDGISYSSLGNGARIPGGWQLTGATLPAGQNVSLRARGRATGGEFNGSSGETEYVALFYRLGPPYLFAPTMLSDGAFQFA